MFDAFQRWLSKMISDVPEEISACEFDCRDTECRMGNWSQCERRQQVVLRASEKKKIGSGMNDDPQGPV